MKLIKRNSYYYLKHSYREEEKVITKEKYIGKTIPKNIEEIEKQFLEICRKESLYLQLSEIIKNKIAPQKPLRDIKETEAHAKLFLEILEKKEKVTNKLILDWHLKLFKETKSYYKALQKGEEGFFNYFIRRYLRIHKKYLTKDLKSN